MDRHKYHLLFFFLSILFTFFIYFFLIFKTPLSKHNLHWSGEAYPFLVLFACLAQVYFSRNKLVVAGMFGMGTFLLGALLHVGHWPGERLFLFAGISSLIIIPMWSAVTTRHQRVLNIIISIWVILYGSGLLINIIGLRAGAMLKIISMAYVPVITIALGVSLWKAKQQKDDSNVRRFH